MILFKVLLPFAFILPYSTLNAQDWIDLGTITSKYSPNNTTEQDNATRNLLSISANVKLPIVLNDNNVLILGLDHQYNSISRNYNDGSNGSSNELPFSSSMLQLGLAHDWNAKSTTIFMAMGRLNSDYFEVDATHFQMAGLALTTTKRTKDFHWKYGVYYNAEFFGPMIVPLFGFNWKINDKWRLKTVLPINLELTYQPKTWFRTGLFFEGINASYRVFNYPTTQSDYLDKADNNLSLFSEFHLGKNIWFHIKAGTSILRSYRTFENNDKLVMKLGPVNIGDDRPETSPMFNDGLFVESKIIYRLPIDNN
tara:strand:- start:4679 stop:5608 length:930 start_codon:yes stop_codon:yes gene_type:complete